MEPRASYSLSRGPHVSEIWIPPLQVFTRLELPGRLAEDISGLAFLSNVRYIDLSNNLIKVRVPDPTATSA